MIEFRDNETLSDIFDELPELLDGNYTELTLNKHVVKLNPDWDRYFARETSGTLKIFTIRDGTKLVGYAGFFLDYHIHYRDILVATNDVLFLQADFRKGMTGIKFLKYCDSSLFYADKIVWHVKASNDFRPILHRMGYKDEDVMVGKLNKGVSYD